MTYVTDLLAAVRGRSLDTGDFYNRIAHRYDSLHRGWMALGGRMAVAAVEGCVAGSLRPGGTVLDAGCGTGQVVRDLMPLAGSCRFTLFDAAPRMLDLTHDLSVDRQVGDLRALPFDDASFDVVMSTWAIETLENGRDMAVSEFMRVLKPGGTMVYCTCGTPNRRGTRLLSYFHRKAISAFFHGHFLTATEAIPIALPGAKMLSFHNGLSLVVIYRKPDEDVGEHGAKAD